MNVSVNPETNKEKLESLREMLADQGHTATSDELFYEIWGYLDYLQREGLGTEPA